MNQLNKNNRIFIVLSFCCFIVYAFYINTFGADAMVMMGFFDISSAQQGMILTMQSACGLAVSVYLALHGERFNKIYVIGFGVLVLAAGAVGIGLSGAYAGVVMFAMVAGLGFTCIDVMMNGVITEMYPKKQKTLLPMTHAFYGSGAMIAPFFVTAVVNPRFVSSFRNPYLIIGVAAVVVGCVYIFAGKKIMPSTPYANMSEMKKRAQENPAEVFKTGNAWLLMAAGILYFAFQMSIATWLPTYGTTAVGISFENAGLMLTMFFGGALLMRFLGPLFLRKIKPAVLFIVFGCASAVLMLMALNTANLALMNVLVVAAGFLQGSNVVALVILCCDCFPKRTASASAIVVFAVNAASMTAPLLVGEMAGTIGFRLPLALSCCLMFVSALCVFMVNLKMKKEQESIRKEEEVA